MSEIDVLDIVLGQIGDLRVPMREKELRDALDVIFQNLYMLKTAAETNRKEREGEPAAMEEEATEDV